MATVTRINNGVTQAMNTNEFWNNFPVSTPYMSQTGISGQDPTLLDQTKWAVDIDNNIRTKILRGFPIMNILEKVSGEQTMDGIMHTWTDRIQTDGNTIHVPLSALRQRDFLGTNAAGTARGVAGTAGDITSPLGNIFEIGGKMMWQTAHVSAVGGALTTLGMYGLNTLHDSVVTDTATITIGSSALTTPTATVPAGIAGEMKETGLVKFGNSECMVLGYSRSADYTIDKPEDLLVVLSKALGNAGYELKKLFGATSDGGAITWADAGPNGGTSPSAAMPTYSFRHIPNTSKMLHMSWDMLYSKFGFNYEGLSHKLVGVREIIFCADMRRFVLILDFSNSNIDFLESSTILSNPTVMANGAKYLVTAGATADGLVLTQGPGTIVTGDGTAVPAGATVTTIPRGYLLEEVNTSYAGDGRLFSPATGIAPEGWTRFSERMALHFNSDMQDGASAAGSFNLDDVLGGYHRTEKRGRNFLQIFRSKVWGQTRLAMGQPIRNGGSQYEQDKAKHLAQFYAGINWTILMGKLQFSQVSDATKIPSAAFAYNSGAGLDGEYNGKMSGLLDHSTFPMVWARYPFHMARPGYNVMSAADQGFALVEYLEKLVKGLNYKRELGTKATYSAFTTRVVVNTLGLAYAKNAAIVSDTGNIFGTSIRYNSPEKTNMGFESYTYIASDGTVLNFVIDDSLEMSPRFKCPRYLLGKEYVNPRFLILFLNKQDITIFKHKNYKDQIFNNLQPNHNVNITVEGAQGSRSMELRNPEEQMIVDISPTTTT